MADKRFNIVYSGKLVEGKPPQEVLNNLCSLLEMEQKPVRELFNGGFGTVILKDLEGPGAYAMREALRNAGAVCTVQEIVAQSTETNFNAVSARKDARQVRPAQRSLRPAATAVGKGGPDIGGLVFRSIIAVAIVGGGWWGYQCYLAPH
jgi:hypothetical protein